MSVTWGHEGLAAVSNRDWERGVELLTKALSDTKSPSWLLARSQALCQLKRYDEALLDAEQAYHVAASRGSGKSRSEMIDAQYRRAVALHRLGRYADSDCCAKWSMLLAEGRPASENDGTENQVDADGNYTFDHKEEMGRKFPGRGEDRQTMDLKALSSKGGYEREWNRAYTWRSQTLGMLGTLPADHPGRKIGVTKVPPKPKKEDPAPPVAAKAEPAPKPTVAPGSVPDEKMKTRIDFYQTDKTVTITLFLKEVKKEDINVQFFKDHAFISPIPREAAPYVKAGDREAISTILFKHTIVPLASRWSATARKIELVVEKETKGLKWKTWGEEKIGQVEPESTGSEQKLAKDAESEAGPSVSSEASGDNIGTLPSNPPSKGFSKNWEQLRIEDDDEEKDVNSFFKKLFKNSTPEQQRAMMKSFTESNGTALSTDWNDVKDRTVETVPPEGVEARKWKQ